MKRQATALTIVGDEQSMLKSWERIKVGHRPTVIGTAVLALLLSAAPAAAWQDPAPAPGSDRFEQKSATRTFTHLWDLALVDGRIWRRPRAPSGNPGGPWEQLPCGGLPCRNLGPQRFEPPQQVVAISADGENLIALDQARQVYYVKLATPDRWKALWGMPRPAALRIHPGNRGWSISHRGTFTRYYEDIDGNPHPVDAGVTTLYMLSHDGSEIRYADPWLPPVFGHLVCTPNRGRVRLATMTASASTLFVADAAGHLWTRLYDYDSSGQNPVLPYTWSRNLDPGTIVRSLPAEEWRAQPMPRGRITDRLTIFQTGEGNHSRELRVEGLGPGGRHGYYRKGITDPGWEFVATDLPLEGRFFDSTADRPLIETGRQGRRLAGWTRAPLGRDRLSLELDHFDMDCPPAVIRLTAGQQRHELLLHVRRYHGQQRFLAMLELPKSLISSTDPAIRGMFKRYFRSTSLIPVMVLDHNGLISIAGFGWFQLPLRMIFDRPLP